VGARAYQVDLLPDLICFFGLATRRAGEATCGHGRPPDS